MGLAVGMEGAAYALNDDLVAKVWKKRSGEELRRIQLFYKDLSEAPLSFHTPRINEVLYVNAWLSGWSNACGRVQGGRGYAGSSL